VKDQLICCGYKAKVPDLLGSKNKYYNRGGYLGESYFSGGIYILIYRKWSGGFI
jgi:hypothetical protein